MERRTFVISTATWLFAPPVFAQTDILREVFEALPEMERRFVQVELMRMQLYHDQIDMRFGPVTRTALLEAAALISRRTSGEMTFDLEKAADVQRYLSMMAQEEFMFIYDDGYEG